MALYQFQVDHYGKVCYDEDLEERHKFLNLQQPQFQTDRLEKLEYEFFIQYPSIFYKKIAVIYSWTSPTVPIQKYILFEIDRRTIGNSKYKFLKETYIKVLTEDPTDSSDRPRQLRFWVREDWVMPFEGRKTYEEDICLKLLKKLKAK